MNDDVYQEGYVAFVAGIRACSNPYTGHDSKCWRDGWDDAKKDEVKYWREKNDKRGGVDEN